MLRVVLITSRDTGRWVIPKGNIDAGYTAAQAAEKEALEEAGLVGKLSPLPLGFYPYFKKLKAVESVAAIVEVYAMKVVDQLPKWRERKERTVTWVPPTTAARLVHEPGLAVLLLRLEQILEEVPE